MQAGEIILAFLAFLLVNLIIVWIANEIRMKRGYSLAVYTEIKKMAVCIAAANIETIALIFSLTCFGS